MPSTVSSAWYFAPAAASFSLPDTSDMALPGD
jgi:hypothetical protein